MGSFLLIPLLFLPTLLITVSLTGFRLLNFGYDLEVTSAWLSLLARIEVPSLQAGPGFLGCLVNNIATQGTVTGLQK